MNKGIKTILPIVEKRLLQPDIRIFKIGKTEDVKVRFNAEEYNDYDYAQLIAEGKSIDISNAENDLIEYFKGHSVLKNKCINEKSGSAGNPNATQLYIVAQGPCPSDPRERLLDKGSLIAKLTPAKL